jgi:hypothetical protein
MQADPTDPLSDFGRKLLKLDPNAYSTLLPKGPGNAAAKDLLEVARPADLLAGPVARADEADALLVGLWLYYDWLRQAHERAQLLPGATGSFWHAICHRREGDFANAKYWYARCENHPVRATLAANAPRLVNELPADKSLLRLIAPAGWDPAAFVDLVEQVHNHPDDPRHTIAVALQKMEWQTLFDHCTRCAAGR